MSHPGIAAPLATGISDVAAYLAEDFVASDSLDVVAREQGPAPPPEATRMVVEIAAALDFAADANILHGALHPRDILVSSDDARLTGFGIAHALDKLGVTMSIRRPYTAPERQAGQTWDRRADIFSLAAIAHELIWGRRITAVGKQASWSLTPVGGADMDMMRNVFARALAASPGDRFESAAEFASELKLAFASGERQLVVEEELRLPLEADSSDGPAIPDEPEIIIDRRVELDAPAADVEQEYGEVSAAPEADETRRHEETRPYEPVPVAREVESEAPAPVMPFAAQAERPMTPVAVESPTTVVVPPPAFAAFDERPRSSLWPLALSLAVGLAVGFAAGYASGGRAGSQLTVEASAASVQPVAQVPATPLAGVPETEVRLPSVAEPETSAREAPPAPPVPETRPAPAPGRASASEAKSPDVTRSRAPSRPPAQAPTSAAGSSTSAMMVESRPSNANVRVDGRLVGKTPLKLPTVAAGDHAIAIEHDGYRRWTSSVRIVAGKPSRITASLER